jgi:hypothetical protein
MQMHPHMAYLIARDRQAEIRRQANSRAAQANDPRRPRRSRIALRPRLRPSRPQGSGHWIGS